MAKKVVVATRQQLASSTAPNPKFPANLFVTGPSLVVDKSGKGWWIDPQARRIERAF